MEGRGKVNNMKMDLIVNVEVELSNHEKLKCGYFDSGCIFLGSKEAIG